MNPREWLSGLLIDNRTGGVSTTRTAYFGAFLAATFALIWQTVRCNLTEWMMFAYLGAFVTGSLGSKAIMARAAKKGKSNA